MSDFSPLPILINVEQDAIISNGKGKKILDANEVMIVSKSVEEFERILNVK